MNIGAMFLDKCVLWARRITWKNSVRTSKLVKIFLAAQISMVDKGFLSRYCRTDDSAIIVKEKI